MKKLDLLIDHPECPHAASLPCCCGEAPLLMVDRMTLKLMLTLTMTWTSVTQRSAGDR
jgi:hypothetical protein